MTSTRNRIAAAFAAAGVVLAGFALFAPAASAQTPTATVAETRAAGCNPSFSIAAGVRTIRNNQGCAGHKATLIHDRTPGVADPVDVVAVFDLGDPTFTVPAAILCGQVDVFNDDVTAAINAEGWRAAGRLWTAVDATKGIPACDHEEEATTTVAPTTTEAPTTTTEQIVVDDTLPPAPTTTVTYVVDDAPTTTTTTAAVELVSNPPAADASLPVTGRNETPLIVAGVALIIIGAGLVRLRPATVG